MEVAMRCCAICNTSPPVDPYKGTPNRCRACHRAAVRQQRRDNPERFQAYERARYTGDRRQRIIAAAATRRRQPGPKHDAHTAVGNAVRDGRLTKPTACSCCAREGVRIEGHHDDYSKPLDVIWLCCRCHRRRHADLSLPF